MFDNIGQKIKTLAIVICVIEIVAIIVSGVAFVIVNIESICAVVIAVPIACVLAYAGSFLLVGFGELIIKVSSIESKLRNDEIKEKIKSNPIKQQDVTDKKPANPTRKVDYACERIKITEHKDFGNCSECYQKDTGLTFCEIKCDLGTKERFLCDSCIQGYLENQK